MCRNNGLPGLPGLAGLAVLAGGVVAMVTGCASDAVEPAPAGVTVPATYEFASTISTGSGVAYTGQAVRQLLVHDMIEWIVGATAKIDGGKAYKAGDVKKALLFYYDYKSAEGADVPIALQTTPATLQATYGALGDASLKAKIAGNDAKGQHKDWTTGLRGWTGATSPEGLVLAWFDELDALAVDRSAGKIGKDPTGNALTKLHITEKGHDLHELLEKFLLGAVAFSQGVDDYLDDDLDNKGLLSDNTKPDAAGAPFTALEHAWDEAFGYFGAARDFGDYSDLEIAGKGGRAAYNQGFHDTNGDGKIDLRSEINWGATINAAKRDAGAASVAAKVDPTGDMGVATDFTKRVWDAFRQGRAIIASANGKALTADQKLRLAEQRDIVVSGWEACMAASIVHYINEVIVDMRAIGGASYDFYGHASHWSEMKGFALALQFNRTSPMANQFDALHQKMGVAPVFATATQTDKEAAIKGLLEARKLLMDAYGFHAALAGDDNGVGGW